MQPDPSLPWWQQATPELKLAAVVRWLTVCPTAPTHIIEIKGPLRKALDNNEFHFRRLENWTRLRTS